MKMQSSQNAFFLGRVAELLSTWLNFKFNLTVFM